MAREADFGSGCEIRLVEGKEVKEYYVFFPLGMFRREFVATGIGPDNPEDHKALVFKWRGIRPSQIERTHFDMSRALEEAGVRLYYWMKDGILKKPSQGEGGLEATRPDAGHEDGPGVAE